MIPERKGTRTREEILRESPILKAMVDPMINRSFVSWQQMFEEVVSGRRREILKIFGDRINDQNLNSVYKSLDLRSVFKPEIDEVPQIKLIVICALVGFEVGNEDEISMFGEEIIKPFVAIGTVYDNSETRHCFMEAAKCGIAWREDIENEVPTSIRASLRQIAEKL